MKILAITPAFLPHIGGIETVIQNLAITIKKFGVIMDVAHVSSEYSHIAIEEIQGLKIIRVPLFGNSFMGWASGLSDLTRKYDLLHVHDPQLLAITANVRLSSGHIPAVLSTHGGFWHTSKYALIKTIYEKTLLSSSLRHYRRVLASSVGDEKYF